MIQVDEHIFQMGWFNHQIVLISRPSSKWLGYTSLPLGSSELFPTLGCLVVFYHIGSYGKFTCFFWYFCLTGTGIYPLDHIGSVQVEQFHVFIYIYIYIYMSVVFVLVQLGEVIL